MPKDDLLVEQHPAQFHGQHGAEPRDFEEPRGRSGKKPSSPSRTTPTGGGPRAAAPSKGRGIQGGPRASALDKGTDLGVRAYPPDSWSGDARDYFHASTEREWSAAAGTYLDQAGGFYESAAVTNRKNVIDKPSAGLTPFKNMERGD